MVCTNVKCCNMLESFQQKELHKVFECSLENRMEVNNNKTKFMQITTRQKLHTLSLTSYLHLHNSNTRIENITEYKVLGLIIARQITCNSHAQTIIKQAAKTVHQQEKNRNFTLLTHREDFLCMPRTGML